MDRPDQRQTIRDVAQHGERFGERARLVDIRWAMQRDDAIAFRRLEQGRIDALARQRLRRIDRLFAVRTQ